MAIGGVLLRFGQTGLRVLEFACAAIILGIYSYFLSVLADKNMHIPTWEKAVEGMSGAAVLYTIFGVILTLCLGGISFFAAIAVFLDILFAGCFAAIAYYTRHGASRCKGVVNTPLGTGLSSQNAPGAGDWGYVCSLNTACFAVAIVSILLFLITAAVQLLLVRHHRKEKRFGPSPANNYTGGSGRRAFWKRNRTSRKSGATRDAEMATAGAAAGGLAAHHHHDNIRPSGDTHMTGTTVDNGYAPAVADSKYGQPGYGQVGYNEPAYAHHHTTTGPAATNY